jgi:hypothetical protein
VSTTTTENIVSFREPMMLTWPAQSYWYPFLAALHEALGHHARLCYDDKDIIVPSNFRWTSDGYYLRLEGFDVTTMRFNERSHHGYETPERPDYRITVQWHDHNRVRGFSYERIP